MQTPLRDKIAPEDLSLDDSSEDEGMQDYKIGGYHPVHVGEILNGRYCIVQKLGWGHFSTVWLTRDLKYNSWVAMKIQKSASHYIEAAYDEVGILNEVSSFWKKRIWKESIKRYYKEDPQLGKFLKEDFKTRGEDAYCVQLFDSFMHAGPNGNHYVMVFEIMGVNLLEVIKRYDYKGVPLPLVRIMAKQCLMGLDYLHRVCSLIHTDLKPENVILNLERRELEEIWKAGHLTTTNIFNLPKVLKDHLEFDVYNIKKKDCMSKEDRKQNAKREKKRRKKQRQQARKRREKWIAQGLDPDAEEAKWQQEHGEKSLKDKPK